jgi:hypothetical protein
VVDDLPRLVIEHYDLTEAPSFTCFLLAADADPDGATVLEWDMALSREHRRVWWQRRRGELGCVVAPYRVYEPAGPSHWAHLVREPSGELRWLQEGESWCDVAAFGMIYLPRLVLAELMAENPRPLTDARVSSWHAEHRGRIAVDWSVRPIHLHS